METSRHDGDRLPAPRSDSDSNPCCGGRSPFYRSDGITAGRLMTDNGSADVSVPHALVCRALGIRHFRTHPTAPRPTAKAESLNPHDAARVRLTAMLSESVAALSGGSRSRYNFSRRHGALGCRRRSGGYRSLREQRNRHLQLDG